jgi:hypothetical protein
MIPFRMQSMAMPSLTDQKEQDIAPVCNTRILPSSEFLHMEGERWSLLIE